jgi:hypothetical protein
VVIATTWWLVACCTHTGEGNPHGVTATATASAGSSRALPRAVHSVAPPAQAPSDRQFGPVVFDSQTVFGRAAGSPGAKQWERELAPELGIPRLIETSNEDEVDIVYLWPFEIKYLQAARKVGGVIERWNVRNGRKTQRVELPADGLLHAARDCKGRLWVVGELSSGVDMGGVHLEPGPAGEVFIAILERGKVVKAAIAPRPADARDSRRAALWPSGSNMLLVLARDDGAAFAVELDDALSSRRTVTFGLVEQVVPHGADQWLVVVTEALPSALSLSRLDSGGTRLDHMSLPWNRAGVLSLGGAGYYVGGIAWPEQVPTEKRGWGGIARFDSDGKRAWLRAYQISSESNAEGHWVEVWPSREGGVLALLKIQPAEVDGFDLPAGNRSDLWIIELDAAGRVLWTRPFPRERSRCTYSPVTQVFHQLLELKNGLIAAFHCPGGERTGSCLTLNAPNCRVASDADAGLVRFGRATSH